MSSDNKNTKDPTQDLSIIIKDTALVVSYNSTKTNKLITALYMVTDMMDNDEPIKNRLRTLGVGVISDMNSTPPNASRKIVEILSFLDISCSINIISQMNCSILRKEFSTLHKAIEDSSGGVEVPDENIDLSKFFETKTGVEKLTFLDKSKNQILAEKQNSTKTSIGVQKGSTLMKALSDKGFAKTEERMDAGRSKRTLSPSNNFADYRKQRRDEILSLIKTLGGDATIKDIKDKAMTTPIATPLLSSCGDKTLQRELLSMVKDNILDKRGEKRWSRYFLKKES